MKIIYGTKSGDIPKVEHYKEWWDDDANEVKEVVNANDDELQTIRRSGLLTNSVKLDLISGYFVNSANSPMTSTIPIDTAGAIQGGQAAVWYNGSQILSTTFTGSHVIIIGGENAVNELCCVFILYDSRSNGILINILSGVSEIPPIQGIPVPPTSLVLTEGDFQIGNLPAAPTNLILTEGEF